MGSIFLGVPLSATETAPKIVVPNNRNPSTGIRAPITVDDESDFEYSGYSSMSPGNISTSSEFSGSDTEPERAASGEDEPETDTERPYAAEEVDVKTFPRPSSEEDKELFQETSSGSSSTQRGFSRPSKNPIFRPSVRIQDEERDDNPWLYWSGSDELVGVDDYVPKIRRFRPVVPIALISKDSDEDSQGSEVSDDDSFSGSVGVPKVRVSELDLGVGNEPLGNNDTEVEVAEDSVADNAIVSSNGETDKEDITCVVEGSSATIQDEASDAESRVDSLFAGEVHTSVSEPEKNELDDEEIQSMDLLKGLVSSPEEPVELPESVVTELEHTSDSGEPKSSESSYGDNLESDENIWKEITESNNVQNPTHNLFFYNAAVDSSVDRGVEAEEVLTHFSEYPDTLMQIKQGHTWEQEIQETEHIHQFSALLDASMSDNSTESEQESFALSSQDSSTDQNQEIDGPIISYLDITRSTARAKSNRVGDSDVVTLSKEQKEKLVKIHLVRVKYLRLLHRLGFSPKDSIPTHVLFQLTAAEAEVISSQVFDLSYAEEEYAKFALRFDDEESDFCLKILVIGKTGVGKSSSVNSIFGETKASVGAFEPTTNDVKEINGTVQGVKITAFDTPGLRTASSDKSINEKVLKSIEKMVKKTPPDVVLFVDRLDESLGNLNDLPVFKAVSSCLGSSMWSKSIFVLTNASSLPLDGPEGQPLSCGDLASKRSRAIQDLISLSCGEMNPNLMAAVISVGKNPLSENLRSELLLLCYSVKTLSEVHSIVSDNQISFFLSSLLQSNDPASDNHWISPFKPQTQSQIARFRDLIEIDRPILSSNGYDDGVLVEYELHAADRVLTARNISGNFDEDAIDVAGISFNYPIDENETSLGLSFVRRGGEVQSWFSLISRRNSKLKIWAGLKSNPGRISLRMDGSDRLQLAAMALLSVASAIFKKIFSQSKEKIL